MVKIANSGDLGSISGSQRSPGEGDGNRLQYPCLGNPMDRGDCLWGHKRVGPDLATKQQQQENTCYHSLVFVISYLL